jgi:cytochrome c nitrite reductase small subunit
VASAQVLLATPTASAQTPLVTLSRGTSLLAVVLGLGLGVGGFTFRYAEGLSYMSNDPRACKNCHIMNEQFDDWRKSSHHAAATCNDCHVPIDFFGKYMAKASNGYHHSRGFTLQDFHEPIMIKAKNSQILQDNCLRCHGDLVHEIVRGSTYDSGAIRCVHCHRGVGHTH